MPVSIIEREVWSAKPAVGGYVTHQPTRITVHHFGGLLTSAWKGADTVRATQKGHMDPPVKDASGKRIGGGRGWKDIGYHFIIGPDGTVWRGRPERVVGSHVADKNTGNLGISVYGNFMKENVPQPAIDALAELLADLSTRHSIPIDKIYGHKDQQSTDCPGNALYALLPEIRKAAAAIQATGRGQQQPTPFQQRFEPEETPKGPEITKVAAAGLVGQGLTIALLTVIVVMLATRD
jgi:hypothetical protein